MLAYYGPEWESLASRMVDRWCTSWTGNTGLQFPSTMGRNHGTLTNFANNGNDAYVASPDRLALGFDGSNDHVTTTCPGVTTTRRAVSVWFRTSVNLSNFQYAGIVRWGTATSFPADTGKDFGVQFGTDANFGTNGFGISQYGNAVAVSGFNDGKWHHGYIDSVGSLYSIYVDGIFRTSKTMTTNATAGTVVIGRTSYGGVEYFPGQLDDIILFSTNLTPNEIQFIYEQGRGGGLLMQPPRRRSVAAVIAALVLACDTGNYSLSGQSAGLFAGRSLAADQAQYLLSGNAANTLASRLLSSDPATYTVTGNDAATLCARLLDGGAAAYALTSTDAGLIANRKLTADQAICFLAGNNAELLRTLKLNAGSMQLQLDNFAASLLAGRKISADGAQYLLVVSDANLTSSASGVAPYYYLFMMRGPQ